METAAVITAAGLSSRMGAFKPMLKIGNRSIVKHVIHTFQQVGIEKIAVVTGHRAEELQLHLAEENVVLLYNEQYRTCEMFDSVKLGLAHWANSCGRVLFTPVDVPLFSAETIKALLISEADAACPICGGKRGHPLMLSAAAVRAILADSGEGGLKGAVSRLGTPLTLVEVQDPGVLRDADTPEEFAQLLEYHAVQQSCVRLYPTDKEIEDILTQLDTPPHILDHCRAVCEKALSLTVQADAPADLGLLRAACLLHDMARATEKQHADAAAEFLARRGYPALAQIIAQHHDLSQDAPVEAQLLYLADKLIQETSEVSLHARFAASRKKCTALEALERWQKRYNDALRIAERYQLDIH